jgi:hypothetical protein
MPDHQPDRDKLSPTGPAKAPSDKKRSYDEKHPHAGTVEEHPDRRRPMTTTGSSNTESVILTKSEPDGCDDAEGSGAREGGSPSCKP